MKLDVLEDGYLFFTNKIYSLDDEDDISLFLKEMFISINDIHSIELYGYFKVDIYIDEKIGIFVEINKLDDYTSYSKKIDTKIMISRDSFYFKTNDLSLINKYHYVYKDKDDFYYVSTKDVDNVLELLDFCCIEYDTSELELISI